MNSKIKILIGVLVVGVLLIGGWWIWNSQKIKEISGYIQEKSNQNITIENYTLISYSNFKPGENATFKIGIPNHGNKTKSIAYLIITIYPPGPPPGGGWNPLTGKVLNDLKILPGGEIITVNLETPSLASSGKYLLRIFQIDDKDSVKEAKEKIEKEKERCRRQGVPEVYCTSGSYYESESFLVFEKIITANSKLSIDVILPGKIVEGKSFPFKVKVKNIDDKIIHDVRCILDTHYYFSSNESLTKMSETPPRNIGDILPGEEKEIIWNLTPTDFGDRNIDVWVYSKDGGSYETLQNIHVLQPSTHMD